MENRVKGLIVAAVLTALAGCARAPQYTVSASGAVPGQRTSYAMVRPEGEPSTLSPEVEAALATALARHGLVRAEGSAKPELLLFAGLSRRPAKVGSFTRDNPADSAEAPGWVAAPQPQGRRVTTLVLRFVDPATGTAVRSVRAEVQHGKRQGELVISPLIDTAAAGEAPVPRAN